MIWDAKFSCGVTAICKRRIAEKSPGTNCARPASIYQNGDCVRYHTQLKETIMLAFNTSRKKQTRHTHLHAPSATTRWIELYWPSAPIRRTQLCRPSTATRRTRVHLPSATPNGLNHIGHQQCADGLNHTSYQQPADGLNDIGSIAKFSGYNSCVAETAIQIRKSKDYVYGIWVYKVLGIWNGYYRVKNH